jgi:polyferredoxin
VDAKLDHVERRIDAKIVELHRNLREMRDRELRHRLRILRITLILTVLVAVLSLGYKWFAEKYFG